MNKDTISGYALFDLDQTIIPWDTQLLFCNFILKKEPLRRFHIVGFVLFLPFVKILGSAGMKRVFLNYLAGMNEQALDAYAREFVDEIFPDACYLEVVQLIEAHRNAGHLTVLNSASPDLWVKYLAEKMKFDLYFGTQVELDKKMKYFPDFTHGENNKGAAKITRMKNCFPTGWKAGDVLPNSYGYSDSDADIPMLNICETNTLVNPTVKLREYGAAKGWKIITPERPTKGRWSFVYACIKQALGIYR